MAERNPPPGGPVRLERQGDVGVIVIDNPPANAASAAVRAGLVDAVQALADDGSLVAGVIVGAGANFIAGADIAEFDRPPVPPPLEEVNAGIETCPKPVLAAIRGAALGGGLEVALACDARIAVAGAVVGLPEVTLGVIPGAGGTQRLPRLVGIPKAIELIAAGKRIGASEAEHLGIVDAMVEEPLRDAAVARARTLSIKRHVSALPVPPSSAEDVESAVAAQAKRARGRATATAIEMVRLAGTMPFADAVRKERETFQALRIGEEAAALRHLFFAERAARKVDRADGTAPLPVETVGIVGGGTMGVGIAAAFAASGFRVALHDSSREALERAETGIAKALDGLRRAGVLGAEGSPARLAFHDDISALAGADLVIEAVFEDIAVKTEVLGALGALARPEAIIATNTSYLDLDALAAASGRPERALGLHFFAPAHRMKLMEVARGRATAPETVLTGMDVARRLGKVAVLAGAGEGFIGNRIFAKYRAQAEFMLEEGALPQDIDAAAVDLGFAMGPFAVADLTGLDISWRMRRAKAATRDPRVRYVPIADALCEAGRLGRKVGMGWYDYPDGGARGVPSPVVTALIEKRRPEKYRGRRLDPPAIRNRLLGAIVNEAANVLEDGIARHPGDIDVVFVAGFGFDRLKGGPVFQALRMPEGDVDAMIDAVEATTGFGFRRGDLRRLTAGPRGRA